MAQFHPPAARQSREAQRRFDPMSLRRFDPTMGLQADFERFSRLFDMFDIMPDFPLTSALGEEGLPRVDVRDKPDAVEVIAELPGVDESDIDVSIGDGVVTLRAETEEEQEGGDSEYRIRERSYGRIERVIPLQTAGLDPDNATAKFKNGLLRIRIPKTQGSRSGARQIKVERGGSN